MVGTRSLSKIKNLYYKQNERLKFWRKSCLINKPNIFSKILQPKSSSLFLSAATTTCEYAACVGTEVNLILSKYSKHFLHSFVKHNAEMAFSDECASNKFERFWKLLHLKLSSSFRFRKLYRGGKHILTNHIFQIPQSLVVFHNLHMKYNKAVTVLQLWHY